MGVEGSGESRGKKKKGNDNGEGRKKRGKGKEVMISKEGEEWEEESVRIQKRRGERQGK